MGFLSGIGSWLLRFVIQQILGRLFSWLAGLITAWKRNREIAKEAKDSVQPLKDAKTPEEVRDATRDALDKF